MMKEHKWLIVLIVCSVITFIGIGIGGFLDNDITGNILSPDFLEIVKMQKLADILQMCCGVSLVFWLVGIGNYVYGLYVDFGKRVTNNILGAALLGTAFFVIALYRATPIIAHDAEVRVGTVCDTSLRGGRVRSYFLEFEDGEEIGVSQDQWRTTKVGDCFYVIYCGDKLIEILDMENYQLPATQEID